MKMKSVTLYAAVLLCAFGCLAQPKPRLSNQPLTSEQQAIYRTFLATYDNGAKSTVNLGNETTTFKASDSDLKGCLSGIDLTLPDPSVLHSLTSDVLPGTGFRLVDPKKQEKEVKQSDPGTLIRKGVPVDAAVRQGFAAGLFSFSEIAFSKGRRYAAFQYSFYCGSLCGHGALVIYENVDGTWKQVKGKMCSFWDA
jgi:hypothetical protein